MKKAKIEELFNILRNYLKEETMISKFVKKNLTPFQILVATILSARTRDELTEKISLELFKYVREPKDLLKFEEKDLARKIYPVGFYRNKARILINLAKVLEREFGGKVPDNEEDLLKLPGVGRKTANIVLSFVFNKPAIAVDTHVHRISNRLGLVRSESYEETELELKKILPRNLWKDVNLLLVPFGKKICKPINPRCDSCPIKEFCKYHLSERGYK